MEATSGYGEPALLIRHPPLHAILITLLPAVPSSQRRGFFIPACGHPGCGFRPNYEVRRKQPGNLPSHSHANVGDDASGIEILRKHVRKDYAHSKQDSFLARHPPRRLAC